MKKLTIIAALLLPLLIIAGEKYPISGSSVENHCYFAEEKVTANDDACITITPVLEQKEETDVIIIVKIMEGERQVALLPVTIPAGTTKGNVQACASMGGVMSQLHAGQQYTLSVLRTRLK